MKAKRTLALLLAAIMMVSVLAIPASAANSSDTDHTYRWSDSTSRYDYTPGRPKEDSSFVYIKTEKGTLPYNGYYAATQYKSGSTFYAASAGEYLINDYWAYTIRPNGTTVSQVGKYVRIRGHYSDRTYTWGDCKIVWSPDTVGTYPTLN